jgi:hypothetical protein
MKALPLDGIELGLTIASIVQSPVCASKAAFDGIEVVAGSA